MNMKKFFVAFLSNKTALILTSVLLVSTILGNALLSVRTNKVDNDDTGIALPIIMYHSILKSSKLQTKYIITPEKFEEDLVWLKNNGYTTVLMSDLIGYVYDGIELPEKPVMITFDDGYYNNLVFMFPLLKKHGMKAVVSIVGSFSEIFSNSMDLNPAYAHLTWDNIKLMKESGLVEFQNHSYNMHTNTHRKGCKIMENENVNDYRSVFCSDVTKNQTILAEKCGIVPNTFTYPYGYICDESEALLKEMGFLASLSCYEKINYITRDKDCLFSLKRFNRDSTLSTQKFMKKIT